MLTMNMSCGNRGKADQMYFRAQAPVKAQISQTHNKTNCFNPQSLREEGERGRRVI